MQTIGIVTADSQNRVKLHGAGHGQRFKLSVEGDRFILQKLAESETPSEAVVVRDEAGWLVARGRPVTNEDVRLAMEDWP